MEILQVTKLDSEDLKLGQAKCACAGYEGYCALLIPPPMPRPPMPFPL